MNTADWVGIATLLVAAVALIRTFRNDGRHWIEKMFDDVGKRIGRVEEEHKSYKDQQSTVLQDHYLHRRDFDKHEKVQKEDFDEIKAFMREMREKMERLPEVIIQRLGK